MKFRAIYWYEIKHQARQLSSWLLIAVSFLFGFSMLRLVTLTDGTMLNAPSTIVFVTVFASIIWVVIGGVIAGDAATRDFQTKIYPLTFTTPVTKKTYLGGRFAGALTLNCLIFISLFIGIAFSYYGPGARIQMIGPFRFESYATTFTFLALPTILATTSIQFAFAALSGRAIASYIASILIIIFSQFGGTAVKFALEWKRLGSLMDLLGTSIIMEMEGWTPLEKNTRLLLLEGSWLWNRLAWTAIAVTFIMITYFSFKVGHSTPWTFPWRRKKISPTHTDEKSAHPVKISVGEQNSLTRTFGLSSYLTQIRAIAWASFITLAKSRGGLTLVAMLCIGTGLFATEYMEHLGVPLIARTHEVLRIIAPPLDSFRTQFIIIPLLTIFYAGELIWREREAGVHDLTDVTPVRNWVLFLGKFAGLALVVAVWVASLLLAGVVNQLVMGHQHFELSVYVKALFGFQFTTYLLFALLMLVIHVIANQKYIGHIIAFGVYGFIIFASMLGINHNLLVYASDPGWAYSDISGFDPYVRPWLLFKIYWSAWAFLFAVAATLSWVRGKETTVISRFEIAKSRLLKYKISPAIAVVLVLLVGGFAFFNTNILNEYTSRDQIMELRALYETRYDRYNGMLQPVITATNLNVDIYPDQHAFSLIGSYELTNSGSRAIDSIHITTLLKGKLDGISFDRDVTTVIEDKEVGYRVYKLLLPLQPNEKIKLNFSFEHNPSGISNTGFGLDVLTNGSHIASDWLPVVGYDENRRIHDPRDREEFGLPARRPRPSLDDLQARYESRHAQRMNFEAIISTNVNQIAVAPGSLKKQWKEGDRHYYHYKTDTPIHNGFAIFSAAYAIKKEEWTRSNPDSSDSSVTIEIYHHPKHHENIDRMMKSARASLDYYSKVFGPYPFSHFRVLERPGAGRGMHAEAMTIDYQEGYSLMNPSPRNPDLPYHIMAHEAAHQWWGFQLAPAAVEGAGFLVESFATYSAMQVVEETLGYDHLLRYLSQMRHEYEVPRSKASAPLLKADNSFLNYRKGPFALFALRNYIGKDRVNQAMRAMLRDQFLQPPLPTTRDFYAELERVTPDSLHYVLHDLFATNTFWELKTETASLKKSKSDLWEVTLEVDVRKIRVDSIGTETEIEMNDWIEIGVYAPREWYELRSKELYQKMHRLSSGKHKIVIEVLEKPGEAGVDARHLLIDLHLDDNVKRLKIEGEPLIKDKDGLI